MFDVWAHDPSGLPSSSPVIQQGAQAITDGREVQKLLVQFLGLPLHQFADVKARSASRPLDRDDLLDIIEREPEALCLAHEGEQVQRLAAVHPVARLRAPRRRQNPSRFVQTQRLPAGPAAFRDLTDQQAIVSHDQSLNLYPRGKVKRDRASSSGAAASRLRPQEKAAGRDDTLAGLESREHLDCIADDRTELHRPFEGRKRGPGPLSPEPLTDAGGHVEIDEFLKGHRLKSSRDFGTVLEPVKCRISTLALYGTAVKILGQRRGTEEQEPREDDEKKAELVLHHDVSPLRKANKTIAWFLLTESQMLLISAMMAADRAARRSARNHWLRLASIVGR